MKVINNDFYILSIFVFFLFFTEVTAGEVEYDGEVIECEMWGGRVTVQSGRMTVGATVRPGRQGSHHD
jgi:hypothetical protein